MQLRSVARRTRLWSAVPDLTDELCKTLGAYGAKKVFRAEGPEGLAQRSLT